MWQIPNISLLLPFGKSLGCKGKLKSPSDLSPRTQAHSGDWWPVEHLFLSRPTLHSAFLRHLFQE